MLHQLPCRNSSASIRARSCGVVRVVRVVRVVCVVCVHGDGDGTHDDVRVTRRADSENGTNAPVDVYEPVRRWYCDSTKLYETNRGGMVRM